MHPAYITWQEREVGKATFGTCFWTAWEICQRKAGVSWEWMSWRSKQLGLFYGLLRIRTDELQRSKALHLASKAWTGWGAKWIQMRQIKKKSKRRKNPKFYESMGVMCSDRLDGSVVLFWQSWQVLQKWSCLVWKPSCFNLSKNVCQKLTRSHMLWRGHVIQNALSSVAAMLEVFRFGTALLCSSFAESIFMMVTACIYLQLGTSKYMKPRQETSRNHLIAWQVFSSFSRFLPMHLH